jgi:hypothetical protein
VEVNMDISELSIDELARLRDDAGVRLQRLVAARQDELKAEADRLAAINDKTVLKPSKKVKYRDGANEWSWISTGLALSEEGTR